MVDGHKTELKNGRGHNGASKKTPPRSDQIGISDASPPLQTSLTMPSADASINSDTFGQRQNQRQQQRLNSRLLQWNKSCWFSNPSLSWLLACAIPRTNSQFLTTDIRYPGTSKRSNLVNHFLLISTATTSYLHLLFCHFHFFLVNGKATITSFLVGEILFALEIHERKIELGQWKVARVAGGNLFKSMREKQLPGNS